MSKGKSAALYPLRFREIIRNYSFGDRWIARAFAKAGLPAEGSLGETWEVCDRPKESSEILNGPLAGRSLREAIDAFGADLLGSDVVRRFGPRFPLLIKLLDASHTLGEQVHPNDELTAKWGLEDYCGKTEAWYMLHTRPGARVFCGPRPGLTRETLTDALLAGQARSCMNEYPVSPGGAFLLYAGTMHYSPGALLFYEIMQNSDVYVHLGPPRGQPAEAERLRLARRAVQAVHLEEGFDCRARPVSLQEGPNRRTFVLACEHFALERLDLSGPGELRLDGRRFCVLTVIEGRAVVGAGPSAETLEAGQSCLLPARLGDVPIAPALAGPASAGQGSLGRLPVASVLVGYVPDLAADVISPLRAAGVADQDIAALGGTTKLNPLRRLL